MPGILNYSASSHSRVCPIRIHGGHYDMGGDKYDKAHAEYKRQLAAHQSGAHEETAGATAC